MVLPSTTYALGTTPPPGASAIPIPAIIAEAWAQAWTPPDRRQIYEWAHDHVDLAGQYAKTGPFSLDDTRYLIAPLEHAFNDRVRMLNLLKAVQTFGTGLCDVYLQWVFANAPGPFMWNGPTDDDAEAHYLTRHRPTFEKSPTLTIRNLHAALRKKRSLYIWPHMQAYYQGANMNSLQMKSIRYQVNDEVWEWVKGMLEEALARTTAFSRTCKIFNISQGGLVDTDWHNTYEAARRHDNGYRCPACSHLQPLEFFGHRLGTPPDSRDPAHRAAIVWDPAARRADNTWNYGRVAETTRLRCINCGTEQPDTPSTWATVNRLSEYLLLDPDRPIKNVSFRWTALVRGQYADLAVRYLRALELQRQGSTHELQKFYQKELARFWDPSMAIQRVTLRTGETIKEAPLTPGYKHAPISGEVARCITADFQQGHGDEGRHYWVVCRAHRAKGHGSRLLYEGRVKTSDDLRALQLALGVNDPCVCIDGSYDMMDVAATCAKYGWVMLCGDDPDHFRHAPPKNKKNAKPRLRPFSPRQWLDPHKGKAAAGRTGCWRIYWSNPTVKNILYRQRHAVGTRWELPADLSPDYKDQIDSEHKIKIVSKKTNAIEWTWVKYKEANHLWDCECMQTVFALILGLIDYDAPAGEAPATPPPSESPPSSASSVSSPSSPLPPSPKSSPSSHLPLAPHDQPEQLTLLQA